MEDKRKDNELVEDEALTDQELIDADEDGLPEEETVIDMVRLEEVTYEE